MTFYDDGLHLVTRLQDSHIRWENYSEAILRDGMYLLRVRRNTPNGAYVYVPRRAFATKLDEEEFRALIGAHLSATF